MLRRIAHHESDRDFLIETVDLVVPEIGPDIECETVNCRHQRFTHRQQIPSSTVAVRFLTSERFPVAILCLTIEPHKDACCRPADRDIEYVCCYFAHS